MFVAHIGPVTASAPPFGTISSVLLSFAAFAIASVTPEWTVPTMTSTLSRLISLLTLSVAFDGSDSSSTLTYSISRPASLPPCSSTYSRKPFSIALPSAAYVPLYGSMKPTLSFGACAVGRRGERAAKPCGAATSAMATRDADVDSWCLPRCVDVTFDSFFGSHPPAPADRATSACRRSRRANRRSVRSRRSRRAGRSRCGSVRSRRA